MYSGEITGLGISAIISEIETRHATGTLFCRSVKGSSERDTFKKSLIFSGGVFCAASSTLSDDRLGEVLYRRGLLSLEVFVSVAEEVNTNLRFGEILVDRGLMSSRELWEALSEQSRWILWTLFQHDALRFEFHPAKSVLENRHALPLDMAKECERAREYALDLRRFRSAMEQKPKIRVVSSSRKLAHFDFFSEMLDVLNQASKLQEYFERSGRPSTERALDDLFTLYIEGYIENELEMDFLKLPRGLASDVESIITWSSSQIAKLADVARGVSQDSWPTIVRGLRGILSDDLGLLSPVDEDGQLNARGIIRTLRYRSELMNNIRSSDIRLTGDPVSQHVRRALERGILYILFELYNRKAASGVVLSVHKELDAQRARWI